MYSDCYDRVLRASENQDGDMNAWYIQLWVVFGKLLVILDFLDLLALQVLLDLLVNGLFRVLG